MNVIDVERGLIGCFGIIGGSIGAATGAALAAQKLKTGAVAVAFFGDGTVNQATSRSASTGRRVESLPVVFVCENNLYMEYTPTEKVLAGCDLGAADGARGCGHETVDGNDVLAVREAARGGPSTTPRESGPAFLETLTYRIVGHSRSDPAKYRKPVRARGMAPARPASARRCRAAGSEHGVDAERIEQVDEEVAAELAETVERALAAPLPDSDPELVREFA